MYELPYYFKTTCKCNWYIWDWIKFFTDRAVTISSDDVAVIPQHKAIQEKLIELKDKLQCELLVCGRAFKNAAISSEKLNSNFTLSGNFELSSMIATADRVIEF